METLTLAGHRAHKKRSKRADTRAGVELEIAELTDWFDLA